MAKGFISYAHEDKSYRQRLEQHLVQMRRNGELSTWSDIELVSGQDIHEHIGDALNSSDLFLPLVSPAFLASEFCYGTEMKIALERKSEGKMSVLPIIVRACDWQNSPLGSILALPDEGKPISEWTQDDAAYLNIVREIRRALKSRPAVGFHTSTIRPGTTGSVGDRATDLTIRRKTTDKERFDYLQSTFNAVRNYFRNSLEELERREGSIEVQFEDSTTNFTARIFENGSSLCACRVTNTGRPSSGIRYSTGQSEMSENSYNGWANVDSDDYGLYLNLHLGISISRREERVTEIGVAEGFWKEFFHPLRPREG